MTKDLKTKSLDYNILFKSFIYSTIIILLEYSVFKNIKNINSIEFKNSINHFDLVKEYPNFWKFLNIYIYVSTYIICVYAIYNIKTYVSKNKIKEVSNIKIRDLDTKKINRKNRSTNKKNNKKIKNSSNSSVNQSKNNIYEKENYLNPLNPNEKYNTYNTSVDILLGFDKDGNPINICESGLFQNMLVTGSIGSGKTSSAMYSITRQLLRYQCFDNDKKIGMLILDVKGNYNEFVKEECSKIGREDDLIIISPKNNIYYNPLDKKELNAKIIASRLKYILLLFSPNNTESFWIDKAEQLIAESIKFIRIYNYEYVNFNELNKIVTDEKYYFSIKENLFNILKEKLKSKDRFKNQKIIYELKTFIDFYENEFLKMDSRTKNIIVSEIGRMTNLFITDYEINRCFSPKEEKINFFGFEELIQKGKIVVLNMNLSEYSDVSKIIASYLKLDFQSEVLKQLGKGGARRITAFISDEYQEYVTKNDADFYAQSREAKCINIISTQSYTSIKDKLKDENTSNVIIQNLVNKICFRTDDEYTIERLQKIIGKEEKSKTSITIGENSKESNYSFISKEFISDSSSINESINRYSQFEYRFDYKFFSQELETFEALGFITNGKKIFYVDKINMIPYFLYN